MVEYWLAGAIGGFGGTIVMTVLMMPMMKGQPSGTQMLLGKVFKRPATDRALMMPGMAMHFGYGTFWGLALGLAANGWNWKSNLLWAYGLGLGFALFLVMMMVWSPIIGMRPPKDKMMGMMMGMVLVHLVYGGVTGAVTGLLV